MNKVIHYIWFGEGKLGDKDKVCIDTWKRHLSDYEIIGHTEENYNIHNECEYFKESYRRGKYALCADVARLRILNDQGGIYFDTDFYLFDRISDKFLYNPFVMGMEGKRSVSNAFIINNMVGTNDIIKYLLHLFDTYDMNEYSTKSFIMVTMNKLLREWGMTTPNGSFERTVSYKDTVLTYLSRDYFYPIGHTRSCTPYFTDNTVGMHTFEARWLDNSTRNSIRRYFDGCEVPDKFFVDWKREIAKLGTTN